MTGIYYIFLGKYPGQAHTREAAFCHDADASLASRELPFTGESAGWPGILRRASGAVGTSGTDDAHPSHGTVPLPIAIGNFSQPRTTAPPRASNAALSLGGSLAVTA